MPSRLEQARQVADDLLAAMESGKVTASDCLLQAKRLARLMNDADAQAWFDLEMRGYPEKFVFSTLGRCEKYARQGGRITNDNRYWRQSLPEIEAASIASRVQLEGLKYPSNISPSIATAETNSWAGVHLNSAISNVLDTYKTQSKGARESYVHHSQLFQAIRAAIHNYVTETALALGFGSASASIFEQFRAQVDAFVAISAPRAVEQFLAIEERMREGDPESFAHALTSCRRILCTVADAVFPPQGQPFTDRAGKARKVGEAEYKNRLMAYLETRLSSRGDLALIGGELEHLASRLDSVYEKTSKGVHAEVTEREAQLTVLHTYLLIAEVARAQAVTSSTA